MTPREEAFFYAQKQMPREACGLFVNVNGKERFFPCRNIAEDGNDFVIHPEDYAMAEDAGDILKVFHSHVYSRPFPSETDKVSCEVTNLPWVIVSVPNGEWFEFTPSGYKAPLIGRSWCHQLMDCYSIIRDYYKENLNVTLPDFTRDHEWWNKGQNLYVEHFRDAGFYEIDPNDIQPHDVILMQIHSNVVNHGAIYLGNDQMLHHLHKRLSCREVYGGYYAKHTIKVIRYAYN